MADRAAVRLTKGIERRIAAFLRAHDLTPGPLLVGVSGGPDSVCLLTALAALRKPLGLDLHGAHLEHGLRGQVSRDDHAYVIGLCLELGFPLISESADVGVHRRKAGLSIEEAARELRYAFFARAAEKVSAKVVLVGHTADDQAETVLMHILRGSGLTGLRGMQPLSKQRGALLIGRPLLGTSRAETVAYCAARSLMPREDASNLSLAHLRNRLRQELLPVLRQYNPQVNTALLRLAEGAGEAAEFLEELAEKEWRSAVRNNGGVVQLLRVRMAPLAQPLQRALARRAIELVRGDLVGVSAEHVERLLALLGGPAGKVLRLPGLHCTADYEGVSLSANPPAVVLLGESQVAVPGTTDIPGWRITVRRLAKPVVRRDPLDVCLATGAKRLWVRGRRPGDRFQSVGMANLKKLQDFFVDARVPRAERDAVPLLTDGQALLWVVGHRLAQNAVANSGPCLRVTFRRLP